MTALLDTPISNLVGRKFQHTDLTDPSGRVEVWEEPKPGRDYVVGADFALGLEGRDWDTACVLKLGTDPVEQVCELQGHWGPTAYHRVLYALLTWYNGAFLLGEMQFGYPVLRALFDEYSYGRIYQDRTENKRARTTEGRLGYAKLAGDVTLPKLRRAVMDGKLLVRSRATLEQMGRLQFAPKSDRIEPRDATDVDLKVRLAGGGSPDLIRALQYAWHAVGEVPWYEPVADKYPPGSLGQIFKHAETEAKWKANAQPKGNSWVRKRR